MACGGLPGLEGGNASGVVQDYAGTVDSLKLDAAASGVAFEVVWIWKK